MGLERSDDDETTNLRILLKIVKSDVTPKKGFIQVHSTRNIQICIFRPQEGGTQREKQDTEYVGEGGTVEQVAQRINLIRFVFRSGSRTLISLKPCLPYACKNGSLHTHTQFVHMNRYLLTHMHLLTLKVIMFLIHFFVPPHIHKWVILTQQKAYKTVRNYSSTRPAFYRYIF